MYYVIFTIYNISKQTPHNPIIYSMVDGDDNIDEYIDDLRKHVTDELKYKYPDEIFKIKQSHFEHVE